MCLPLRGRSDQHWHVLVAKRHHEIAQTTLSSAESDDLWRYVMQPDLEVTRLDETAERDNDLLGDCPVHLIHEAMWQAGMLPLRRGEE